MDIMFNGIRQVAPMLIPSNTFPWGQPSPYLKWHLHQLRRFCTAQGIRSLYYTMDPQNCPCIRGDLDPCNTCSLDTTQSSSVPFPVKIASLHGIHTVPWTHPCPQNKQHLDWFSRFCRAHDRDRQTYSQRYSICNNGPHTV